MNKFEVIIGIILLLIGIYIPISIFENIPPFGADNKDLYVYYSIPLILNELPDGIEVKDISKSGFRVRTYNQIQNPEYYGLELNNKTKDYGSNPLFYLGMIIFIICISKVLILIDKWLRLVL